jgi:hypothetical protein
MLGNEASQRCYVNDANNDGGGGGCDDGRGAPVDIL